MKLKLLPRALPVLAIGLALALTTFYGCPERPQPAQIDTVAHWSFDGNLRDITGHQHDGTPIGNVHYSNDRWNSKGRALVLDESASVLVHDSSDLHFNGQDSYTISFWIRTASASNAGIYSWGYKDTTMPGLTLDLKHGRPHVGISAKPKAIDLTASTSIADSRWHLLTVTVSAPHTVTLYVDTNVAAQSATGQLRPDSNNAGPVRIGRRADSTAPFMGMIAKGIIFKTAVRRPFIVSMYNDDGPYGPPILGMCSSDGSNVFACDQSGRVASGTLGSQVSLAFTSFAAVALNGVDVSNSTHYVLVGDQGNAYFINSGPSTTLADWTVLAIPVPMRTGTMVKQNIYAVRILGPKSILVVGGYDDVVLALHNTFALIGTTATNWDWASANWVAAPGVVSNTGALNAIAIDTDKSVWIAGSQGKVYRSTSPTTAWTNQAFPDANKTITSISFGPVSPNPGVLTTDDGTVYRIHPSWSEERAADGNALWTSVATTTDRQYAGGEGLPGQQTVGILRSLQNLQLPSSPTGQVWFSSCRTPSGTAGYVGGYSNHSVAAMRTN